MTSASSSRRRAVGGALAGAVVLAALACQREAKRPSAAAAVDRDPRPYTPWHRRDEPMPFPTVEWYWQDLLAVAPAPEPLPADADAAQRIGAAFERVAQIDPIRTEEELPALVEDARRDPAALLAGLDDARDEVRFAAARTMLRLMTATDRCVPQRLVAAAGAHLRDASDEVALIHLETIARSGFPWTQPLLLKVFGKVDNHRLTVLRIRAAAKLVEARCYGGVPLLIKALKEQTSLQDDVNREWDASLQTAWWKEEAIDGIAAASGGDRFGHSPDASDDDQVASVRRIEQWWAGEHEALWSAAPPLDDPALVERIETLILAFGTFQIRNVDNAGFILAGLGPKVAPRLFEALHGSSFMIRRHVLAVLAELVQLVPAAERARYVDEVKSGLSDPDVAIRVRSLEVIGNSRLELALPIVEKALTPGEDGVAETALRLLATWRAPRARSVLEHFAASLAHDHPLRIPAEAARLAAGDLEGLDRYLQLLGPEKTPDARAQLYLSWILDNDGLADAKTPEDRRRALQRIETEIRNRAKQ